MDDMQTSDTEALEFILDKAGVCRLGMCIEDAPYVVPMNFGYKDSCIYLHSSAAGTKIDILKRNDKVCVEVDIDHDLVDSGTACTCGMKYKSVIAFGRASFLEEPSDKAEALDTIVDHYFEDMPHDYTAESLEAVTIIKVELVSATVKEHGF